MFDHEKITHVFSSHKIYKIQLRAVVGPRKINARSDALLNFPRTPGWLSASLAQMKKKWHLDPNGGENCPVCKEKIS